jgi:hypothetical protein
MSERVPYLPEVWFVPPMLADFECRHGRIGGCRECDAAAAQSKEEDDEMVETRWTRERVIEAIREVGEKVGGTPTGNDMREAGYGGAYQVATFERLKATWAELVEAAGYEPRVRGAHGNGVTDPVREETDPVREELDEELHRAVVDEQTGDESSRAEEVEGPTFGDPVTGPDFELLAELVARVLVARERLAAAEHEFWAEAAKGGVPATD